MRDLREMMDWLADGARSAPSMEDVLAEFCEQVLSNGIPICRVGFFVLTLHPQIMGQRFLWTPSGVHVSDGSFEVFQTEEFRRSTIRYVIDNRISLRRKLEDKNCPIDFPQIPELLAEGATDYLALPLFFGGEAVHGASFATEKPGGFTDKEIAALDLLMPSLTRVIENHTLRRTAGILLETYVGHHAGPRVLAGQIRRGDTAVINAAIWLSDMRGFTELSDRLPPQSLVDLLNRYFDCQVPVIRKHGGEVLKFMGDGLLAIFAISSDGEDERAICEAALAAARETRSLIAASFSAERSCDRSVSFGLALHVGEVMYGNIGSEGRLDFTCIGPAVNLAARIEKLTGELRRSILASDTFARHFSSDFNAVGEFRLRGFGSARTVFGLKDENEATELRGATNS